MRGTGPGEEWSFRAELRGLDPDKDVELSITVGIREVRVPVETAKGHHH